MAEALNGKLFADKYRIESLLRRSEAGNFYLCRHAFTERSMILQVLDADAAASKDKAARFAEVARAVSRISHRNVLAVADVGRSSDGYLYTAFENVDGETLAARIERDVRLPIATAIEYASEAAAGLAAARAAGLIHGSLSDENIFLTGAGEATRVKIYDFCSSNAIDSVWLTTEDRIRALGFAAPELCTGSQRPDERSDVYSLGAVMYKMLAGAAPFTGAAPDDVINGHIENAPPPLSAFRDDLTPGIEPTVLKALAKDPELRFQSVDEFARELESGVAAQASPPAASSPAVNNNLWKTAFIVVAGISLLSVLLIFATSVKKTDPPTALQPDANSQPVQPINPATGADEQNLASTLPTMLGANSNTRPGGMPDALPGGDGYNAWANGGVPPPGGPRQTLPPAGQTVTIPPGGTSPFTSDDSQCIPQPSGLLLCPVPVPTVTVKPTPRKNPANANIATPAINAAPKATPTPAAKPASSPSRPAVNSASKP